MDISFFFFLLLTFIIFGRPADIFLFLIPFRLAFLFTFINILLIFISKKKSNLQNLFFSKESKKFISIYVIMIIGIPFAYHKGLSFEFVFKNYLNNVIYFYLFLYNVYTFERLKKVFTIICISIFIYSSFSLASGMFSVDKRLSFGVMFDSNDLAMLFVTFLPINIYFIFNDEGLVNKIIASLTVAISTIVVLMTGSRGGFFGLTIIILLLLFTDWSGIRKKYKATFIAGLIVIFFVYGSSINSERLMTILDIQNDYNVTSEQGRLNIWKTGLAMLMQNPLTGVGVDCFAFAIGYKRAAAGDIPLWQAAHNSFIQFLTEVGIIGFLIFISMIANCNKCFSVCKNAENLYQIDNLKQFKNFSGLLQISFIGHITCIFFLSKAYSIVLTLFFVVSTVMRYNYSLYEKNKISDP